MKLDVDKLDSIRNFILYSWINPQDCVIDVGFSDNYKLSEKELEYIYAETDKCNFCGSTVDLGDLYDHDTEGDVCDSCYSCLEEE